MDSQATRTGEVYGSQVKMVLTEVVNDQNIKYLNTDDDDEPGVELYVTQAFATGTCLAVSVLDSILSTAYYNHQAREFNGICEIPKIPIFTNFKDSSYVFWSIF